MKRNIIILSIIALMFASPNCTTMVPVWMVDYQSEMGGANVTTTKTYKPVIYSNNRISGVSENKTTTALMYKDETGKYVTKYSNTNNIQIGHIEMVGFKKNFVSLGISRYFYKDQALMSCCTLGSIPPFVLAETIYMQSNSGIHTGHGSFGQDFVSGKPIDLVFRITNSGDMSVKDDFLIVDVLPNYFELQSASYTGNVKEVAYDLHAKQKNNILAFKITPGEKGFGPYDVIMIKVLVKPILSNLTVPEYSTSSK